MALTVGAIRGTLPAPLAVSYVITAMAGVVVLVSNFTWTRATRRELRGSPYVFLPLAAAVNGAAAAALLLAWPWYFLWLPPYVLPEMRESVSVERRRGCCR